MRETSELVYACFIYIPNIQMLKPLIYFFVPVDKWNEKVQYTIDFVIITVLTV